MRLHLKMIILPVRTSIKHCDEMRVFSTTSRKQRGTQTLDVDQLIANQRLGSKVKFVFRRIHAQLFSCCQPRILKLHKIASLLRNLALKFKARRAAIRDAKKIIPIKFMKVEVKQSNTKLVPIFMAESPLLSAQEISRIELERA